MKLILKLTLANIWKNKLRTFMIIFSILLSTALIYAVLGINGSVSRVFENQLKKESGTAELFVSATSSKGLQENFENPKYFEYSKGVIQSFGYVSSLTEEVLRADLHGYEFEDLKSIHKIELLKQNMISPFRDQNIIIGEQTAKDYNLTIGDPITLAINGKDYSSTVWGIAKDQNNILTKEVERINLVLPRAYLQDLLNLKDAVTSYFLKVNDQTTVEAAKIYVENTYPEYQVSAIDVDAIQSMMNIIVIPLLILVMVVVVISVFIIYSAFKVIAIERLPVIGTLRSIGSTKKSTSFTLLCESFIYGTLGGILGSLLGIVMEGVIMMLIPGSIANLQVNSVNMLIAIFGAITLSVISALIPIVKTMNMSIKDIITNTIHNNEELKLRKIYIGFIFIILAFLLFELAPKETALPLSLVGIILLPIGAGLLMPLMINIATIIISICEKMIPSTEVKLALSNIKNDKTIHNNIVLMGIGLGVILLVNTLIYSIMVEVLNIYDHSQYDIMISRNFDEQEFDNQLSQVKGVESVYRAYEKYSVEANDGTVAIGVIDGIDEQYFDKGWDMNLGKDKNQMLSNMKNKKGILLSSAIAHKNELSQGDFLELNLDGNKVSYEIVGIVNTVLNNGQMGFISKENFEQDFIKGYQVSYYINTAGSEDAVKKAIQDQFSSEEFFISTLKELRTMNIESNNTIFILMKSISIIAMLIGIIGIFNNYIISYLSRKRIFAVLRSIGLANGKMMKVLLMESLLCGIIGAVSGVGIGFLFLQSLKYVFVLINLPPMLHYSGLEIAIILISGIMISLLAAMMPIFKMNKMSIVENLKYE